MAIRLEGTVIRREAVGPELRARLHALFTRYYLNVDRDTFDRDLDEKDWVLLLRGPRGEVLGFTTMMLFEREVLGRPVRVVFNGNTIVERQAWGDSALVAAWCRFMGERRAESPPMPLYWFLVSSGYRTYLYLPLFYREFFPRFDRETPPFERALLESLGRTKFPGEYKDGVVRVRAPRECLRPEIAVPAAGRLANPHVRFFVERNPGYLRGDELVCLTEFSLDNTLRTAHRMALEAASDVAREAEAAREREMVLSC